jgi:cobalt-zinc-cadmium efflux system outer membrane protein
MRFFKYKPFFLGILLIIESACSNHYVSRTTVSKKVSAQTAYSLNEKKKPGQFDLPPGVSLTDGLSEQDAVSLALWNNAQFQSDYADILIANSEVTTARIIQNPLLRYVTPSFGALTSGYVNFALDFIWQRPKRISAAKRNADLTAENLVNRGFTIIRDVQWAYADLLLAQEKFIIMKDNSQVRAEISHLATIRMQKGDISELEATNTKADSASAMDDFIKAQVTLLTARNQLNYLLGVTALDTTFTLQSTELTQPTKKITKEEYLTLAFEFRPDLKASKTGIIAAGKALGWEKSKAISFPVTLNFQYINGNGGSANEKWIPNTVSPGFQAELPIFNRNQGNIQKAKANLEKASFQYVATLQKVALEVTQSYNQYEQCYQSYELWQQHITPPLEQSVVLATQSYESGETSYLPVLEAMRQLQNVKLRKADADAQLRKAISQLNYSIGQKTK